MYKFLMTLCLLTTTFTIKEAEDITFNVAGIFSGGSGIAIQIDGHPYALTASHVLQSPFMVEGKVIMLEHMNVVNGERDAIGKVVAINDELDLALLELPIAISNSFAVLADGRPEKGSIIHHMGTFGGPDGEDSYSRGYISKPDRRKGDICIIQVDCALEHGSSGGPIFDDNMICYGMGVAMSKGGSMGLCVSSVDIKQWIHTLKLE